MPLARPDDPRCPRTRPPTIVVAAATTIAATAPTTVDGPFFVVAAATTTVDGTMVAVAAATTTVDGTFVVEVAALTIVVGLMTTVLEDMKSLARLGGLWGRASIVSQLPLSPCLSIVWEDELWKKRRL